jgi:dephospho-CoA kinase
MKIIAFAGMPCSGKTEAVQIAKKRDIPVIRMGDMVWEEVKNQGLSLDEKNVGSIADQMRKDFGKDIWAQRTLEKISSLDKLDLIVIDGIRNIEEIETFKKELGKDFIVIAITSSDETRCKRFLQRGREDDSTDIKDFETRDKRELSWGLGEVIASADIVVSNEGTIKDFKDEIQKILEDMY